MKSGNVAIVGLPNAGKSTLLNALMGQHLAIVSSKPETTRACLLGVFISERPAAQIGIIDTPGLLRPKNALGRSLHEAIKSGIDRADAMVLLVDVKQPGLGTSGLNTEQKQMIQSAKKADKPWVLALNKVDLIKPKERMLPLLKTLDETLQPDALVPLSARKADNLKALIQEVIQHLPDQPKLYEEDNLTDQPTRFFASEFVREAVLQHTHEEIPHGVAVTVEKFHEKPNVTHIAVIIHVSKASHKRIVIGKQGSMLKAIGTDARKNLEKLLGQKVMLETFVKVNESWMESSAQVAELLRP